MRLPGPAMPFPPNPDYGTGAARRLIRLAKRGPHIVEAHLADNYHEMLCTLVHDGTAVVGIDGEMVRFPTTACPGAPEAVKELVGLPLAMPLAALYEPPRLRRNCTHLFDIVALAMSHALREAEHRTYEAIVPDQAEDPIWIDVLCDGRAVHRWLVDGDIIVAPAELAGRPMLRGFGRWSTESFAGDALEAATILGKTCFIATVRPYAPEGSAGRPIRENRMLAGACYAYAPERIDGAVLTDQVGEARPA